MQKEKKNALLKSKDEGKTKGINKKGKKDMKKNTNKKSNAMRSAFIRIYASNNTKNGIVNYTFEDIVETLKLWASRKQGLKYYMILHDQDTVTEEDLIKTYDDGSFVYDNSDLGRLKRPHFHIVLEFGPKNEASKSTIINKFPYSKIEPCRYGIRSCVQYLIHKNEPSKFQYSRDKIITNSTERLDRYLSAAEESFLSIEDWIHLITSSQVTKHEMMKKIDPSLYTIKADRINRAFDFRNKRIIANSGDRNVKVFYLQGETATGKTTFCKYYAKQTNKSLCISSASNDAWQDYSDEDCFLYDEFREEGTSLETLLKSIDNFTGSTQKRRFSNVLFIGDTIFITSNVNCEDLYKDADDASRKAFFRRITQVLDFSHTETEGLTKIESFSFDRNGMKLPDNYTKYFNVYEAIKGLDEDKPKDEPYTMPLEII